MKTITAILITCCLIACDDGPAAVKETPSAENTHYASIYFTYFKDTRTNLCFVSQALGRTYAVMTNVPCTPEVLALIDKAP
jgi:hypothetical protein